MSSLQNIYILILIIILLLVLLLVAGIFIITLRERIKKYSKSIPRGTVSKEVHEKVLRQRDELQNKLDVLKAKNDDIYDNEIEVKFEKACVEIGKLKWRIDVLTRENNELKNLCNKNPFPSESDEKNNASSPTIENSIGNEKSKELIEGIIKYASFPRSAGSSIYFSDLTEKLEDDSYFELRIFGNTGKASFRPLDFMKIRNYDPAMAAILTDGVKPNIASTVVGVEPGDAYLEGNDWIIKKMAKVKLA